MYPGACLKNHFRHLHSPIRMIFTPDSGYIVLCTQGYDAACPRVCALHLAKISHVMPFRIQIVKYIMPFRVHLTERIFQSKPQLHIIFRNLFPPAHSYPVCRNICGKDRKDKRILPETAGERRPEDTVIFRLL